MFARALILSCVNSQYRMWLSVQTMKTMQMKRIPNNSVHKINNKYIK